jgi:hypothetical protein
VKYTLFTPSFRPVPSTKKNSNNAPRREFVVVDSPACEPAVYKMMRSHTTHPRAQPKNEEGGV